MRKNRVTPIFIFSLPRSGSTLLQRILASNSAISSASEPWVLLPLLYMGKQSGTVAEYHHSVMATAVHYFRDGLPNGSDDFNDELRSFVSRLYSKYSDEGVKYFLDKTPRYHLIVKEIIELFPDAKFIFLWRNPLAVCSSCIETWGRGKWNVDAYYLDLFQGIESLLDAHSKNRKQSLSVKFENLIENPRHCLNDIMAYLDLPFNEEVLVDFQEMGWHGTLGDPTGRFEYSEIEKKPSDKWKVTMSSLLRKRWCKNYIEWLGKERLEVMGYCFDELILDVDSLSNSPLKLFSDGLRMTHGKVNRILENQLFNENSMLIPSWHRNRYDV